MKSVEKSFNKQYFKHDGNVKAYLEYSSLQALSSSSMSFLLADGSASSSKLFSGV